MQTKRSNIEIYYDMLKSISQNTEILSTQILQDANVCGSDCNKRLKKLLEIGAIISNNKKIGRGRSGVRRKYYSMTEKGFILMNKIAEARKGINTIILEEKL